LRAPVASCSTDRRKSPTPALPRSGPTPRPAPAVEIPGGFRVEDANRQPLAYFYGRDDANAAHQPDVLTLDEARRMAENFARLSELMLSS
jgi:hypothetical protein